MAEELIPILPSQVGKLPTVTGKETVVITTEQEEYQRTTTEEIGNFAADKLTPWKNKIDDALYNASSGVIQQISTTLPSQIEAVRAEIIKSVATQVADGLMSKLDKKKLDEIITTAATQTATGYMSPADKKKLDELINAVVTTTTNGYMSATDKVKLNALITSVASTSADGYMSAADKTKLTALVSTNATQTAAGYMSAADKNKLDGVDTLIGNAANVIGSGWKLCMARILVRFYATLSSGQRKVETTLITASNSSLITVAPGAADITGDYMNASFGITLNTAVGKIAADALMMASVVESNILSTDTFPVITASSASTVANVCGVTVSVGTDAFNTTYRQATVVVLIPYIPA